MFNIRVQRISQIGTILLFIFFFVKLEAQVITVLDNSNLQPIPGVMVHNLRTLETKRTNSDGKLSVSSFSATDSLLFHYPGYIQKTYRFSDLAILNYVVFLTEKAYSLDEVVVSASRTEEQAKDVAQVVQVIRSKELAFMNQQTSADVLQNTGNILVQKSQLGGGSPIIRGFETNKVLIVIDGVRMNNAIYRGGHLQNVITLDNTIMDKIEVVYGPGSVIYGSDALGGVMHFYTKNPILADSSKIKIRSNAFTRFSSASNEFTEHADVSIGGHRFGSLTSLNYSNFGDLVQGKKRKDVYGDWGKRLWYVARINGMDSVLNNDDPNKQINSGYTQYDLLQKFQFRQNEKVNHLINFQYSTSSIINRYDRLTLLNGANPKFAEWFYGPQTRLFASYTLELKRNRGVYDNLRLIFAYQNIEESRNDRRFQNNNLNRRIEQLDIFSFNLDLAKKINSHEFRYGIDSWYNDVNSTAYTENIISKESFDLDTRYPDGGSQMYCIAGYMMHSYEISKKFILNQGIRVNNVQLNAAFTDKSFFPFPFNEVHQNNLALNGNLGLVIMPNKNWRLTILGASGYRAPNVDDLSKVFESIPGSVIVPNPNIKPEYTYNTEFGITKTIKDLTVGGTGFYTFYENAITVQETKFEGKDSVIYSGQLSRVLTNMNTAKANIYGFNLFLAFDVTSYLSVNSTLNYTYGKFKSDSTDYPLDHIPPIFGKTSFTLKLNKFKGEFYAIYNGAKKSKDYNLIGEDNHLYSADPVYGYMPAWITFNIRTAFQFNKMLQLQMGIENLLDQNYRIYASNISAAGRNFIITLRGTF